MTEIQRAKPSSVRITQTLETRNKILNAALHEFSEKGFAGASVRNISAAVGVNHGLIKYHFTNKDQLWKAAVEFLFKRLHEEMTEPDSDRHKARAERVRLWIHRYVRYCAEHPEHARIMIQESIRDSDRLKWATENHIGPGHQILLSSLPVTLDMKRFPQIDIPTLIYMLNAATQAPFILSAEIKQLYGKEVQRQDFVETYAEGIFALFFRPYLSSQAK